jgi:hypothetical protein
MVTLFLQHVSKSNEKTLKKEDSFIRNWVYVVHNVTLHLK